MYKTILVPHAGTEGGNEALKHALYAADTSSTIIILHIIEEIQYPPSFGMSSSEREKLLQNIDEANEEMRKDMEKNMEQYAQQCKEKGITAKIMAKVGDAAENILNVAEENKVDLIVMAKRRQLKGFKKLLSLGSVSRKIVEHSPCPILLMDPVKK